uniref:Uncharacterized protein n=1 Tax=Timema monikensis TaxID=170555 RepID=A0A7R9HSJ5_9NEOP|nr:unnamed protein product [Timema monikensis]
MVCYRRLRLDPDLDLGDLSSLLDNSAARHKLSVRPRRKHTDSRQRDSGLEETRRLVTLLDQQVGGAPDGAVLARCAQPGALVWPSARDLFQAVKLDTTSALANYATEAGLANFRVRFIITGVANRFGGRMVYSNTLAVD